MYVRDVFETLQVDTPCSQPKFFSYLATTVNLLVSKYGTRYVTGGQPVVKAETLDEDIPVDDAYLTAIVDNIKYMLTGDEDRKTDYVQEADDAYRNVYGRLHRRAQLVGGGYYV